MARCTRANIHPSRIPPRVLRCLPLPASSPPAPPPSSPASAPFILASRRVASFAFFSPTRTSPLHSSREMTNLIYRLPSPRDRRLREDTGDTFYRLSRVSLIAEEVRCISFLICHRAIALLAESLEERRVISPIISFRYSLSIRTFVVMITFTIFSERWKLCSARQARTRLADIGSESKLVVTMRLSDLSTYIIMFS